MTVRTPPSDADATERLSRTVVNLIADLEGVDPVELSPPLYSVVDPDALESLFAPSAGGETRTVGHVSFHYCGYEVRVESDGELTILNR